MKMKILAFVSVYLAGAAYVANYLAEIFDVYDDTELIISRVLFAAFAAIPVIVYRARILALIPRSPRKHREIPSPSGLPYKRPLAYRYDDCKGRYP